MTELVRTIEIIERGMSDGLHFGAQVYVSINGQTAASFALGDALPGRPMTTHSMMRWLSCTKPIVAIAIAQLWERGSLDLDAPVARYIPEFGANNKDKITTRHLLTHTAGIPTLEQAQIRLSWKDVISFICDSPLERGWIPGRKAGYHFASSWFILGELINRLTNTPVERYVRSQIFEPLGMTDSWLILNAAQQNAYAARLGVLFNTSNGKREPAAWDSDPNGLERCVPGSSGRGPVSELARFYEMLLFRGELNGARIVSAQTVEAVTARHRTGMLDHTFGHIMDWGLGFLVDSNIYGADTVPYGFGRHCSPRTFGHGGFESSSAFCDPEFRLVVAWVMNGTPGFLKHNQRCRAINSAIYVDLGFAY